MNKIGLFALVLAGTACAQTDHNGFIWIEGPDEVLESNSTYTLEVWGRFESPAFIAGESALAGFWFDIITTVGRDQIDYIWNIQVNGGYGGFGTGETIQIIGPDIFNASGGQLANLFGILNPNIITSNPVQLFTFDIVTASVPITDLEFTPMNPGINGGLSFYPDIEDGATINAPNDPNTSLTTKPWAYQIPSPISVAPLLLLAMARRRWR